MSEGLIIFVSIILFILSCVMGVHITNIKTLGDYPGGLLYLLMVFGYGMAIFIVFAFVVLLLYFAYHLFMVEISYIFG